MNAWKCTSLGRKSRAHGKMKYITLGKSPSFKLFRLWTFFVNFLNLFYSSGDYYIFNFCIFKGITYNTTIMRKKCRSLCSFKSNLRPLHQLTSSIGQKEKQFTMFSEIGDIYFLLFFNTKSYKQKTFPRWLLRGEELAVTVRFKLTFLLMEKL